MWFNQKSSYFLDTFGKQSRYLSKLISGNNVHGVVSSLFEVKKALEIASLNLKVRTSRNQKQKSFISASVCIFKRSYKKRHRLGFGDTNS